MSNWRDDLPEIPGDRILRAAIDEGYRRREARRQRLQVVMYGGLGVGAIALLIGIGALFSTGGGDDDDGGAADTGRPDRDTDDAETEAPAGTEAPGTTGGAWNDRGTGDDGAAKRPTTGAAETTAAGGWADDRTAA